MFDWRMVSASIVAVLVVSGMFVSDSGVTDFLNSIIEKIGQWMKTSPFGGFFTSSIKKPKDISFSIHSNKTSFAPDSKVSLISDKFSVSGFKGDIIVNIKERGIKLVDSVSSAEINLTMEGETTIKDITLNKLEMDNVAFEVGPDMKTDNGSITLTDFSGTVKIKEDGIYFNGKATSFKTKIGDKVWQLE